MTRVFIYAIAFVFSAAPLRAQEPQSEETIAFFKQNCTSCHTIGGGRLAGPDLKGASERKDKEWHVKFLMDPKGVIDSGDPYAVNLLKEARGVYMQTIPGMNRVLAEKLVGLITYESSLEESQFAGTQVSDRPLTDDDARGGEALFIGRKAFASGAPACIGCHSAAGTAGFGGGRLGPDLTAVYARLEGRKALAAWLSSPPSLVMQPVYKKHPIDGDEVLQLVAYLKGVAETGEPDARSASLLFLLSGVGLAAVLLVALDFFWRDRYRAVRRTLVTES